MDRLENIPIVCKGGLRLDLEKLTQGTQFPGSAIILQNYEPSLNGGYKRILGYSKWDTATVPGSDAILATKPALHGVFAIRKTATDNALYYSTGSGWGSILNTTGRTGSPTKARIFSYAITEPAIYIVDGLNPAGKYNGSAYTHINGTGAPSAPKYVETFRQRIVLAPGSNTSSIILSAPDDDDNFDGGAGAIEFNVGDVVKGLKTFRDVLYIFCENSIFKLEGLSISDFAVTEVTKKVGLISQDTIQELGGDVVYLSQSGIRSLAATQRFEDLELGVLSTGIHKNLINYLNYAEEAYSSCIISVKNQYRLFIFDDNIAKSRTVSFLGKLTDNPIDAHGTYEWSELKGIQAYCAEANFNTTEEIAVIGDSTNGFVYQLESGNSFAGTDIEYIFRSPYITLSNASIRKVLHKADIYIEVEGVIEATFNLIYDFQNEGILQPPSIALTQSGDVSFYDSAIYDTSVYSNTVNPIFRKNLIGSGFVVAFQFSGTDSNPPHRIDSFDITFSVKGRR